MSKFSLPNVGVPPFGDMSELDFSDLDIIANGVLGNGVLSGCAVTAQATPDATAAITAGVVAIDGQRYSYAGGNSPAATADATNPRVVCTALQVSGNAVVPVTLLGVPAADPPMPVIPASTVALKYCRLPANSAVQQNVNMLDKTMLQPTTIIANAIALGTQSVPGGAITAVINHVESGGNNRVNYQYVATETINTLPVSAYRTQYVNAAVVANAAITQNAQLIDTQFLVQGNANIATSAVLNVRLIHQGTSPQVVTNSYGVLVNATLNGGTEAITKLSLFGATTSTGGGATVTDLVGLDLSNLGSMAATNKWGIQVGNYQSYHQGPLTVGAAFAPAANSVLNVTHVNGFTLSSPATDVGLLVNGPTQVTGATAVTRIGVRVADLFTNGGATAKSSYIGVQVDPSVNTDNTGGLTESVGARFKGTINAGTADLVVGVDARVKTVGIGTATVGVGVDVNTEQAGSGAAGTVIGIRCTNIVMGTTKWGMQIGNYQSYHQGPLTVGAAAAPTASAALDINSTTGALLLPRMTTTQRDALTGASGMLIFNTTTSTFQYCIGGFWLDLAPSIMWVGVSTSAASGKVSANSSGTEAGVNVVSPGAFVRSDHSNGKSDLMLPYAYPATPRSGGWWKSEGSGTVAAGGVTAAQELTLVPIFIASEGNAVTTITALGLLVETLYTTLTLTFAVYGCDVGGWPVNKIIDTGATSINCATAGFKTAALTANHDLDPGKYWIGCLTPASVTLGGGQVRCHSGALMGVPQISTPTTGTLTACTGLRVVSQASFPASLVAAAFINVNNAPQMYATVA